MTHAQRAKTSNFMPFGNPYEWGAQSVFGTSFPFGAMMPGMPPQKPQGLGALGSLPASNAQQQAPEVPGSIWEQLGGLDGIITNMGKVQKILQMTQSFAPYMKLFTRSSPPAPMIAKSSGRRGRSRSSSRGGAGSGSRTGASRRVRAARRTGVRTAGSGASARSKRRR